MRVFVIGHPTGVYFEGGVTGFLLDEMQRANDKRAEAYKRYVGVKRGKGGSPRIRSLRGGQLLVIIILNIFYVSSIFAKTNIVENLKNNVSSAQELSGKYTQYRQFKDIGVTLKSSGSFNFKRTKEFKWQQTKPFNYLITVTQKQITTQMRDDSPKIIKAESRPVIFSFSRIFLSLFSGDLKDIYAHFIVTERGSIKKWSVVLKPKDPTIKKIIKKISIEGREYLSQILILETSGNERKIQFVGIKKQNQ